MYSLVFSDVLRVVKGGRDAAELTTDPYESDGIM